jgi:YVTN family beta-propeller protein
MSGWPHDELVEARADAILAGVDTVEAYAEHFEAQMRPGMSEARMYRGKVRKLLAPLRVFRRKGVILLAVIITPIGLLGYAAATTDTAPVMVSGTNGVAAVNTASGRLVAVTPLTGAPGAVTAADGSVWVASSADGTVCRIDPRTDQVTASVSVTGTPTALAITGSRVWTGIRRTSVTPGGHPAALSAGDWRLCPGRADCRIRTVTPRSVRHLKEFLPNGPWFTFRARRELTVE